MDNQNANTQDAKMENLLNLALDATPAEREKSLELDVGYLKDINSWDIIVKFNGDLLRLKDKYPLIQIVPLQTEYAIVTIPEPYLDSFAREVEVEFIEKPKRLFFAVDFGKSVSCINSVQTERFNLFGEGIIVAFLDSGIDYMHPDFRNPNGTTRIIAIWDQTMEGDPPDGYLIGTEFTREEINEALKLPQFEAYDLVGTRDLSTHGTAVAGIAAGNGRASNGKYEGVAPKSELLVVKLGNPRAGNFPRTTEIMQGIDYVIKKAIELRKPIAINISFGNTYGSHTGNSLLETYISDISNYWKSSIIIGTGNEGAAAGHTSGKVPSVVVGRGIPQQISGDYSLIELGVAPYESALNLQIWKSYVDEFEIVLFHPNGQRIGPLSQRMSPQRFYVGGTQLLIYYGEPSPYSREQEIFIDFIPIEQFIDSGIWKIQFYPIRIVDGTYHAWLPSSGVLNPNTEFLRPTEYTTLTIPSTSEKVISVGAYDGRTGRYAEFSGRGSINSGRYYKPDLVAPGVSIMTTVPGGGYQAKTGTSFATPFVSGSAALLMEWGIVRGNDPYLYGEKLKAYFAKGARQLDGFNIWPNPTVGWGALCVKDSLPL
ncbi:S8 family peptidase [Anaerosacchariphilus polymeriproducens]|uniref:Peptidase S8 n=1 Tax=Anaerosacchariphilus polymeriproducens TaxID=1812858 RepID=A0A371AVA8_9FIRM|nr:S8 family peptidase [Anaerosacchariphilus polymeriproducens]RDU23514.1 peptidase S8 [Anaerosacchariphilus polymeriproducens]